MGKTVNRATPLSVEQIAVLSHDYMVVLLRDWAERDVCKNSFLQLVCSRDGSVRGARVPVYSPWCAPIAISTQTHQTAVVAAASSEEPPCIAYVAEDRTTVCVSKLGMNYDNSRPGVANDKCIQLCQVVAVNVGRVVTALSFVVPSPTQVICGCEDGTTFVLDLQAYMASMSPLAVAADRNATNSKLVQAVGRLVPRLQLKNAVRNQMLSPRGIMSSVAAAIRARREQEQKQQDAAGAFGDDDEHDGDEQHDEDEDDEDEDEQADEEQVDNGEQEDDDDAGEEDEGNDDEGEDDDDEEEDDGFQEAEDESDAQHKTTTVINALRVPAVASGSTSRSSLSTKKNSGEQRLKKAKLIAPGVSRKRASAHSSQKQKAGVVSRSEDAAAAAAASGSEPPAVKVWPLRTGDMLSHTVTWISMTGTIVAVADVFDYVHVFDVDLQSGEVHCLRKEHVFLIPEPVSKNKKKVPAQKVVAAAAAASSSTTKKKKRTVHDDDDDDEEEEDERRASVRVGVGIHPPNVIVYGQIGTCQNYGVDAVFVSHRDMRSCVTLAIVDGLEDSRWDKKTPNDVVARTPVTGWMCVGKHKGGVLTSQVCIPGWILVGSEDGVVESWRPLRDKPGYESRVVCKSKKKVPVRCVVASIDNSTSISGSADGTIQMHTIDPLNPVRMVATFNLSS